MAVSTASDFQYRDEVFACPCQHLFRLLLTAALVFGCATGLPTSVPGIARVWSSGFSLGYFFGCESLYCWAVSILITTCHVGLHLSSTVRIMLSCRDVVNSVRPHRESSVGQHSVKKKKANEPPGVPGLH